MYSSRKLTRTQGGGGSREWYSQSQPCPGAALGGRGRADRASHFSQQLPKPPARAEGAGDGTLHQGRGLCHDGVVVRKGQCWYRPIYQFSADSEHIDKIEGGGPDTI